MQQRLQIREWIIKVVKQDTHLSQNVSSFQQAKESSKLIESKEDIVQDIPE